MEVIRKCEERCRGSSSALAVRVISSPKSLNKDVMLQESISKLLEEAQKSVQEMKSLLGFKLEKDHHQLADDLNLVLDRHSSLILNSFQSLISILKHCSTHFHHHLTNNNPKLHSHQNVKQTRGCYKRRKSGESWTRETTDLVDDGHAWRKYGQKQILNTKYPRSYYRCTHKDEEKCEATKQVQQTSEKPRKYSIIYNGVHTCKNNTSNNNPAVLLSFETTPTKHKPYYDYLFPAAISISSSNFHSSDLTLPLSPVSDDQEDHAMISAFDDLFNFINIHDNHDHYSATATAY